MFNEQNEIRGDEREDVRAELERIEGYEEGPQPQTPTDEDMDAHYKHWIEKQNEKPS